MKNSESFFFLNDQNQITFKSKARINQRNKERNARCVSLHTASCMLQHVPTDPARLTPSTNMKPEPSWGLLSGWGPAVTHSPWVTEVNIACPRAAKQGFERLAAELGLRKLRRATTMSLWQQPPWHHCPPNLANQPPPTGLHTWGYD